MKIKSNAIGYCNNKTHASKTFPDSIELNCDQEKSDPNK